MKLDGVEKGKTALTLERPPVGEHSLELDKDGIYAGRRQVTIAANTLDKITVRLDRLKGKFTILSDPRDATIFLDGKEIGRTPLAIETEAGPHVLALTAPRRKKHEETIRVLANRETRIRLDLLEELLKAGDIQRRGKDNAEMVYIPDGTFTMGDTHGDGAATRNLPIQSPWKPSGWTGPRSPMPSSPDSSRRVTPPREIGDSTPAAKTRTP